MGQSSCIQILSTKAQVISLNGKVNFDKVCICVDSALSYDENNHQITITKKGLYQVNWWLSSNTARHVKQIIFSLAVNKMGQISYLCANTANSTSGEVSGIGIIEVKDDELPVKVWVENRCSKIDSITGEYGDVYLADASVNGSLSIIQFNSDNSGESQTPLVVAKQVLNHDDTLIYGQRIPFAKDGTEIIPEDKGIKVENNGELTVTKGTYLAIWNVNIMPILSDIDAEFGDITFKVSLVSDGLEKKKIATSGIKSEAYTQFPKLTTTMLSGSTVFSVEDESTKILLENSSWVNKFNSILQTTFDTGISLEVKNAYVLGGDSNDLVAASASSLTLIKIS